MTTVRRFVLAGTAIAALSMLSPATASATPGVDVDAVTLAQSTVDGIDYVTREITIQPGGSTGWHFHDGRVYGLIKEGTLTRSLSNCEVDGVFPAGSAVAEGTGPDHVHIGRNLGPVPLVMWITYVDQAGSPLSEDAPDPGCTF